MKIVTSGAPMGARDERKTAETESKTTPDQLIAYLLYALDDVRLLSRRSTILLANAIAALAEDSDAANAGEIKKTIAQRLWIN